MEKEVAPPSRRQPEPRRDGVAAHITTTTTTTTKTTTTTTKTMAAVRARAENIQEIENASKDESSGLDRRQLH